MPNFLHILSMCVFRSGLVRISASWRFVQTWISWMHGGCEVVPLTKSRTRWQSTSMCLVRSWKTWFLAMCIAAWLSQCNVIKPSWWTPSSLSKRFVHTSSQEVFAIARYSDSALDRATTVCFLLFQEIRFPPKKTQTPVVDRKSVV